MSKKKRKQKTTVYVALEGKRERTFFDFLDNLYEPKENSINITISPRYGGSSDTILLQSIKMKNNYDKVFAWFDEDIKLSKEARDVLSQAWRVEIDNNIKDCDLQYKCNMSNRNPIVIVSSPCSMDGFLIKLCNGTLPSILNTPNCKKTFASIIDINSCLSEEEFYRKTFTKEIIETKGKDLPLLKLILSVFK
jgi:hypothetical protein